MFYLHACVYTICKSGVCGVQKVILNLLESELKIIISHAGTKLWFWTRITSILNNWAITPASKHTLIAEHTEINFELTKRFSLCYLSFIGLEGTMWIAEGEKTLVAISSTGPACYNPNLWCKICPLVQWWQNRLCEQSTALLIELEACFTGENLCWYYKHSQNAINWEVRGPNGELTDVVWLSGYGAKLPFKCLC